MERIVPDELDPLDNFDSTTLKLHRDRYQFAVEHLISGSILDVACGAGYGSYQLMSAGKLKDSRCIAMDISPEAIDYAQNRYAHPFIQFVCKDFMEFSAQSMFDSIVSLETIEHVGTPVAFVDKLSSMLKPGGILIISAPVTPSTDGNPHHLSDFSPAGFRKLFHGRGFREEASLLQVQPYSLMQIRSSGKNKRLAYKRKGLVRFYLDHPAVFCARIRSLLKDGFNNKYLTLALRKF